MSPDDECLCTLCGRAVPCEPVFCAGVQQGWFAGCDEADRRLLERDVAEVDRYATELAHRIWAIRHRAKSQDTLQAYSKLFADCTAWLTRARAAL